MVKLTFMVPKSWRDELVRTARTQQISSAALLRMMLRKFLRGRYSDAEQQAFGD